LPEHHPQDRPAQAAAEVPAPGVEGRFRAHRPDAVLLHCRHHPRGRPPQDGTGVDRRRRAQARHPRLVPGPPRAAAARAAALLPDRLRGAQGGARPDPAAQGHPDPPDLIVGLGEAGTRTAATTTSRRSSSVRGRPAPGAKCWRVRAYPVRYDSVSAPPALPRESRTTAGSLHPKGIPMAHQPSGLFACVHNGARSQMAAGFLDALAGDRLEARSAGVEPADTLDPTVVAVMAEIGIDLSAHTPRRLTDEAVGISDVVVTIGG